jgi:hypothetical protein
MANAAEKLFALISGNLSQESYLNQKSSVQFGLFHFFPPNLRLRCSCHIRGRENLSPSQ